MMTPDQEAAALKRFNAAVDELKVVVPPLVQDKWETFVWYVEKIAWRLRLRIYWRVHRRSWSRGFDAGYNFCVANNKKEGA